MHFIKTKKKVFPSLDINMESLNISIEYKCGETEQLRQLLMPSSLESLANSKFK